MNDIAQTVTNLRKYVADHPKELAEIKQEVNDLADLLENGGLELIQVSNYFKTWKRAHGHIVYDIFADAYRST
jgi:aryl carrier-like protein